METSHFNDLSYLSPFTSVLAPFKQGAEKGIIKRLDFSKAAFQLCTQTGNRKVQHKSSRLKDSAETKPVNILNSCTY